MIIGSPAVEVAAALSHGIGGTENEAVIEIVNAVRVGINAPEKEDQNLKINDGLNQETVSHVLKRDVVDPGNAGMCMNFFFKFKSIS